MKARLNSIQEVEQALNIHIGGGSKPSDSAASWEFRGAKSLQRWMRRAGRRRGARSGSSGRTFAADPRQQRVIVKASYTPHRAGKVAAVLRAHVKYLGRDSASLDAREGRFYDAGREGGEGVDARQSVQEWQNDARHFRFIVSPERGHEINEKEGGLSAYIRELMQRVENDLTAAGSLPRGTRLEWIAINHHNTDDLHAHVLVRGRREDGKELRIDRQYIQQGMAQAARQIATVWLGERTEQQLKLAADKELKADRYTALDSFIERHVDAGQRLQLKTPRTAAGREQRRRVAARLQYVESLGLATRDRHGRWTVDAELKPKLAALAQRNDIIKNLYATLGPRSAFVASYRGETELVGTMAGRGTHDELRDRHYLLVQDANKQLHYVLVANGEAMAALEEGSLVRVSGGDPQRLRTDARIAELARHNGGIYSSQLHRENLLDHFASRDVEPFLQSHQRRLATLEKLGAVQRVEDGWKVHDTAALAAGQHARLRGGLGVVQIVSSRAVQSQINAQAWTWLDRQVHRQSQGKPAEVPFDSAMKQAAEARRRWMIEHGYAALEGERYVLRSGSAQALGQGEWQSFERQHQQQFGQAVRQLLPGERAQGQYRGTVSLHSGLQAIVASAKEAVLAPVQRVPPLTYGTIVQARTSTRGVAVLSRIDPRKRGQTNGKANEAERD